MGSLERPCLIGAEILPFEYQGNDYFRIASRESLSENCLMVPRDLAVVLRRLDGVHSLDEIALKIADDHEMTIPSATLRDLVGQLDGICVLDTPTYHARREEMLRAFRASTVREASHAGGAYESDPGKLRAQIRGFFESPAGPGLPQADATPRGDLRGLLSPHIDFGRGGQTFAWGFKELAERSNATTFVVIGTSHYSTERFVLTRKDFRTPLGVARNDREFVDRIAECCGRGVFEDELAHRPEHSIEFQVLFLQFLFEGKRDFTIVPLLAGSFHDAIETRTEPARIAEVARMIDALRGAEEASDQEVCYIASGDLAHLGMKFGDTWEVDEQRSRWCRSADEALLRRIESASASQWFNAIAEEEDRRRICGLPPTYAMLEAARPARGKVLKYDQFVDPRGFEIVSFASVVFCA